MLPLPPLRDPAGEFKSDGYVYSNTSEAGLRMLARRFRHIRNLYSSYGQATGLTQLFNKQQVRASCVGRAWACCSLPACSARDSRPDVRSVESRRCSCGLQISHLEQILQQTNAFTNNWLQLAVDALVASAKAGHRNVLVSNGSLIPTLAKLMLYGLSPCFAVDCIYSSKDKPKSQIFEQIMRRFGVAHHYCVVGDGEEEQKAAAGLNAMSTQARSMQLAAHQQAVATAAAGGAAAPPPPPLAPGALADGSMATFFHVQRPEDLQTVAAYIGRTVAAGTGVGAGAGSGSSSAAGGGGAGAAGAPRKS